MSNITPSLRLVVITLVVGCVVASLTGATAKGAPGDNGLKIAVVNPARLIIESKFYKAETDKLQKLQQDTQLRIRTWDQNSLLSQTDQQSLADLTIDEGGKAGLDAGKKAEKQKLLDRGKALFDESVALQTKANLAQNEQDRLREFARLDADTKQREQAEATKIKSQIDTKLAEVRDATDKSARDSLNKIAKKDGYNMVFSSEVLLYADNDITDKVVGDINK
ncbi:MAG: Chaperone for outer membrane protein Skp family [Chthonomonadaceae bacterium]|nr:Chaperone for outer membrane protein Skp family [Chthonomonadaceae bacterium]